MLWFFKRWHHVTRESLKVKMSSSQWRSEGCPNPWFTGKTPLLKALLQTNIFVDTWSYHLNQGYLQFPCHTHTRPSITHLSISDCDSHFILTQVEGQSHGEDSRALRCARDRRWHRWNENRLSSEVRRRALRLQDHERVRNRASGVQSGGQRWAMKKWICLV